MSNIDTNINNYTISELMAILNLEDVNQTEITEKTNNLINKFKTTNPGMSVFFQEVQSELLQYANGLNDNNDYSFQEKQTNEWYQNQNLTQEDQNQVNKITNRQQKIDVYDNEHSIMNRQQIATTDTYQLPVKQDSLNPNLKNTINRFINLDSQFRQYTSGLDSESTNYTCDLSDTIKNAIGLSMYSYQIPYSWYVIDTAYGNTCLWIYDQNSNNTISVSITPGNYTQTDFQTQLNASFLSAGFQSFPAVTNYVPANSPVYLNLNSGLITLFLNGGVYVDTNNPSNTFTISSSTSIIFFDFTGNLQCSNSCLNRHTNYLNSTLGWIMGYRMPYYSIDPSGNQASAILDLNGPKYLILVIDDLNQNHVNNSLVSITQPSNVLKVPSYFSPDLPYTCTTPMQQQPANNLQQLISSVTTNSIYDNQSSNPQNGLLIAGKYEGDYSSTQIVLPSAPRTLTQSQIYTINEINKNRNNLTNYLAKAPTTSDILAIIPIKTSTGVPTGSLLVDFSGSLKELSRTYFGPVNIDRLCVKLLDDKGNVLNLNGNDWCVTLNCTCLYQY